MFKKETSLEEDLSKPYEPLDIEYVFSEAIGSVRPDFKFLKTFAEACEVVTKMENEIKEGLSKTAPHLIKEVTGENKDENDDGLETIREDKEDDEDYNEMEDDGDGEEDDEEEEDEDEDSYNPDKETKVKKRQSRTTAFDNGDEMSVSQNEDAKKYENQDQNADSNSEIEDGVVLQPKISKPEVSLEDDEFIKAFDSLLAENIAVQFYHSHKNIKKIKIKFFLFLSTSKEPRTQLRCLISISQFLCI